MVKLKASLMLGNISSDTIATWFFYCSLCNYFARGSGCEVLWWVCLSVVCLCVCVSVCLSVCRGDISGTTRAIFTKFLRAAYVRGTVLLWHVYDRPHRLSPGILPHWICIIGRERGMGVHRGAKYAVYDCLDYFGFSLQLGLVTWTVFSK